MRRLQRILGEFETHLPLHSLWLLDARFAHASFGRLGAIIKVR
jgi:hypothetical protein